MTDLLRLVRVELFKLRQHRLTWGVLLVLLLVVGLRISSLYTTARGEPPVADSVGFPAQTLDDGSNGNAPTGMVEALVAALFAHELRPEDVHRAATLPGTFDQVRLLGDWLTVAIILLGIVVIGQEFSWGTMRTSLARGAPRSSLLLAKFVALAVVTACYLLVLWLACALLGLLTTRSLAGRLDLGFIDGAFWLAQLGAMARTWFILLPVVALTLAINVWAERPGPAVSVLLLGFVLSLCAYLLLPILTFWLLRLGRDVRALGDTLWGQLFVLLPHYSSRIVIHWAKPAGLSREEQWVRNAIEVSNLPSDPWLAVAVLSLFCLLLLVGAFYLLRRKEMAP